MGRLVSVCVLVLVVWIHSGCGGSGGGMSLPDVTGSSGQVLVIGAVQLRDTRLGDTLRSILSVEYPYLPQSEVSFGLTFIPESAFERVLHPFRNILWVHVHPDSGFSVRVSRDRWSSGQLVVYAVGGSYDAVAAGISSHRDLLFSLFSNAERDRYAQRHLRGRGVGGEQFLRGKHGVSLVLPSSFGLRADRPGFSWFSLETRDISQGLLVYSSAARGVDFAMDTLVSRRNGYTRRYVPGPNEGTHMVVSMVVPPEVSLLGDSAVRMRGFWEVSGHAMGGAFVSYSWLSGGGDSVVTCEGYVYAPGKRKREYMRELEAMLGTVRVER